MHDIFQNIAMIMNSDRSSLETIFIYNMNGTASKEKS